MLTFRISKERQITWDHRSMVYQCAHWRYIPDGAVLFSLFFASDLDRHLSTIIFLSLREALFGYSVSTHILFTLFSEFRLIFCYLRGQARIGQKS
jgi:hypothetical protein